MKRTIGIIAGLIILTMTAWFVIQWRDKGGWPAAGATRQTLPPNIEYVSPTDGQVVEDPYRICAHFDYLAGRGMGEDPERTIRFFFDGKNVTRDLVDLVRLEYGYPSPVGEPCYTRPKPLGPGWYTAKVTYEDISGERFEYMWRFAVLAEE